MCDAVVRSKLVYGLDVTRLPYHVLQKLDAFQLKGLRKILKMDTTFVKRSNTNQRVFKWANKEKNKNNIPGKNVKPFSEYITDKQQALVKHIARLDDSDPLRQCTFEPGSIRPFIVTNRRVGRPRGIWAFEALQDRSEGLSLRDMLSLGAWRMGLGCSGKSLPLPPSPPPARGVSFQKMNIFSCKRFQRRP